MLNYSFDDLTNTELRANISRRLHYERKAAGYSLEALAEKLNYSKPTVQSWEKGWKDESGNNTIPTLDQLINIAALYHCTPEYLLCEYDQKTKQITDITLETGIYPENVKKLQSLFYRVLEYPDGGSGAIDLFLAFFNHYISNMDLINELIFNRQMLEFIIKEFQDDQDKDILLDAYKALDVGGLSTEIFKDSAFSSKGLIYKFLLPLNDYLYSRGFTSERVEELTQKFDYYFEIFSVSKIKQSDFALSDSFLDIVKSFYSDFPDNVYGVDDNSYSEFIKKQRSLIDPSRFKSPPIVK